MTKVAKTKSDVDYTTMRVGKKPDEVRRIAVCPSCLRHGLQSYYRDGSYAFTHKIEIRYGLPIAVDYCLVAASDGKGGGQ